MFHMYKWQPMLYNDDDLDCSGKDSGNDECWSKAVNITIPVVCIVLFLVVMGILYLFPPKVPKEDQQMVDDYNQLTKEMDDLKNSGAPMEMNAVNSTAQLVANDV